MLKLNKKSNINLFVILLVIGLSACGNSPEEFAATSAAETVSAATITYTNTPTSTKTPIPPTATSTSIPTKPPTPTMESLSGAMPEGIVITFSKSFSGKCKINGPTELAPGDYSFVLGLEDSRSGDFTDLGHLEVSYLIDGKTSQDLLNHPNMKNGSWWGDAFSLLEKVKVIDSWRNETRVEKYYTYSIKPGEIVIARWTQNPHFYWYCGTIYVK